MCGRDNGVGIFCVAFWGEGWYDVLGGEIYGRKDFMKIKIFSEDTTSCFFNSLTDSLNRKIESWIEGEEPGIEIVKAITSINSVGQESSEDNAKVMTCTVIYK